MWFTNKPTFVLFNQKIEADISVRVLVHVYFQLYLPFFCHVLDVIGYKKIFKRILQRAILISSPQLLEGGQAFRRPCVCVVCITTLLLLRKLALRYHCMFN